MNDVTLVLVIARVVLLHLNGAWQKNGESWSRFLRWSLAEILKLKLAEHWKLNIYHDFWSWSYSPNSEGNTWLKFWRWIVVNILRLRFLSSDFETETLPILRKKKMEYKYKRTYFGDKSQPLGPLCLLQCFINIKKTRKLWNLQPE